jgi:hypothetical protein
MTDQVPTLGSGLSAQDRSALATIASYAGAVSDQAWEASATYFVTGGIISRSPLGQTRGGKMVAGAYLASSALAGAIGVAAKLVKAGATQLDGTFGVAKCFPASTPILLVDGTHKPICDIRIGDQVMAFDTFGALKLQYNSW